MKIDIGSEVMTPGGLARVEAMGPRSSGRVLCILFRKEGLEGYHGRWELLSELEELN